MFILYRSSHVYVCALKVNGIAIFSSMYSKVDQIQFPSSFKKEPKCAGILEVWLVGWFYQLQQKLNKQSTYTIPLHATAAVSVTFNVFMNILIYFICIVQIYRIVIYLRTLQPIISNNNTELYQIGIGTDTKYVCIYMTW